MMRSSYLISRLVLACLSVAVVPGFAAPVNLNDADFRDRVYACWLGKSIGGTLGVPVEGQQQTHNFTFYTPVPTEPAANDDLDLQLLWLKGLEEQGPGLTARQLGEYWLSFVPVDWAEYGIGKANMRQGFAPPLSGQFRNRWRDSNGAWIRSEIWACVAPGSPALAARYAFADACVDHGTAEGTWAEVFTATLESAAFVEHDRDRLLAIALSYIPADCAVAKSVHCAMDSFAAGMELMAAREAVVEASKSTGWFMAPQNVAFVVLGWLYGGDDFGKGICDAVNCGDDTDCTGATLGSLLGILHGSAGIPDEWRKPVGEEIRNVAIGGFEPPRNLGDLTDRTVRMARVVLAWNGAPVTLSPAATDVSAVTAEALQDKAAAEALWARSAYQVSCDLVALRATLDYGGEPEMQSDAERELTLTLLNHTPAPMAVAVRWRAPEGVAVNVAETTVQVPAAGQASCTVTLRPGEVVHGLSRGSVEVEPLGRAEIGAIPFCLVGKVGVRRGDLALASLGAKATSDSELARETGCTAEAIDGVIALRDDFEDKRWHSALTPHPHWIAVELPQVRTVGRALIHFADPAGHPVDFEGQVSLDGQTWQTVFSETGYGDAEQYEREFGPVEMRHFRLVISKSASELYRDAAQVGEVELVGE